MGAKVTWTENSVTVTGPLQDPSKKKRLRAVDVNMNKMPDVAMTLAVVALYADGPTTIRDGKAFQCSRILLFQQVYTILVGILILLFISTFSCFLESKGDRADDCYLYRTKKGS